MEDCTGLGVGTPNKKHQLNKIKINHYQAAKLRRDLVSAWLSFAGNTSPKNAKNLDEAKIRAEIFLREVQQ